MTIDTARRKVRELLHRVAPARHLQAITCILAASHVLIVGLSSVGLTTPYYEHTRHPLRGFFAAVDASGVWIPFHTIAALLLIAAAAGYIPREWSDQACHFSSGVLGAWGTITLIWSVTRTPPLPILGPCLAIILAAVAVWTAARWNDTTDPED